MSKILENLILGSFEESFNMHLLTKYNVTHILNVAEECISTNVRMYLNE